MTYDVKGDGRHVLKAFYGRYYNNLADGFSALNPGGHLGRRVQLPRPERQPALRRACRNWAPCACGRRRLDARGSETSRRHSPRRSAGRSKRSSLASPRRGSPTCARTPTTMCRSTARTSSRPGWDRTPCERPSPSAARRSACSTFPTAWPARPTAPTRTSQTAPIHYDTIEVGVQQARQQELLHPDERGLPVEERLPLRAGRRPRHEPARRGPGRDQLLRLGEPDRAEPPEDHLVSLPVPRPLRAALGHRLLGQLPVSGGLPVLARDLRTAAV